MDKRQKDLLLGLRKDHLITIPHSKFPIHQDALESFLKLQSSAKEQGIDLRIISSFRSFSQQKSIWNSKAIGTKTLLDTEGNPLDFQKLEQEEILFAILRWSALPGFSRHHWGTDIDVYDHSSLPTPDYEVQLTPKEVDLGGIFYKLHSWLDQQIEDDKAFGFYRPYEHDQGGVAPEKWHLSYKPLSENFLEELNFSVFQECLEKEEYQDLLLLDLVKENAEKIFERYVTNIST